MHNRSHLDLVHIARLPDLELSVSKIVAEPDPESTTGSAANSQCSSLDLPASRSLCALDRPQAVDASVLLFSLLLLPSGGATDASVIEGGIVGTAIWRTGRPGDACWAGAAPAPAAAPDADDDACTAVGEVGASGGLAAEDDDDEPVSPSAAGAACG